MVVLASLVRVAPALRDVGAVDRQVAVDVRGAVDLSLLIVLARPLGPGFELLKRPISLSRDGDPVGGHHRGNEGEEGKLDHFLVFVS